jgi:hypothetical protein
MPGLRFGKKYVFRIAEIVCRAYDYRNNNKRMGKIMTKKYLQLIIALVIISAVFIVPVMANTIENDHNKDDQKIDIDITNNNQKITNNDIDIKNTDIDVTNINVDKSVTNNVKTTFDTDITNNNIHNDIDVTNNNQKITNNIDNSKTTNNVDNSVTNTVKNTFDTDITNNNQKITNNIDNSKTTNNVDNSINTDLSRTTNNNDNRDYSINTDLSRTTNNNDNRDYSINTDLSRTTNTDNRVDNSVTTNNNQVTNTDNHVDNSVNQKTIISGSNNEQTIINGGNIGSIGTKTYNQQQYITQTTIIAAPEENPEYYGLHIGTIDSQIVSLYNGEVLVVTNDNDQDIIQNEGDVYRYTIKSSLPVLAYVISSTHNDKAEFDKTNAPFYDVYMHKFDLSNLPTVYVGKYRSPNQQFNVTLPEGGRYSLVIDTRVSQAIDGHTAKMEADSLDVSYTIEKLKDGQHSPYIRTFVGSNEMYPVLENGMADTSSGNSNHVVTPAPTPTPKPTPVPTPISTPVPSISASAGNTSVGK